MSIKELRMRLLEIAKSLDGEDRDAVEQAEVELDAYDIELARERERVGRMEEAGDEMARWLASPRNVGGDPLMAGEWRKAKEAKP